MKYAPLGIFLTNKVNKNINGIYNTAAKVIARLSKLYLSFRKRIIRKEIIISKIKNNIIRLRTKGVIVFKVFIFKIPTARTGIQHKYPIIFRGVKPAFSNVL